MKAIEITDIGCEEKLVQHRSKDGCLNEFYWSKDKATLRRSGSSVPFAAAKTYRDVVLNVLSR